MAKSNRQTTRRESTALPASKPSKDSRIAKENSRLVGLGIVGVVLSIVISVPLLSPLLTTAPIVPPLLRRLRSGQHASVTGVFLRWAATIFLTVLVSTTFVRDRVLSSFPFAAEAARAAEQMMAGTGGAPAGFGIVVVGLLAFVVLAAVSLGVAACLLGSVALAVTAAGASVAYTYGVNLILITLVALPPWLWVLFAAASLAFTPAALVGGSKLYGIDEKALDWQAFKRRAIIVSGLFVVALLLRLLLAGPYLTLVRHWTVL
jgi:hypothetical protein